MNIENASCEYRAGYAHGQTMHSPMNYAGFDPVSEANRGYGANPFANRDYASGYKAGANWAWWTQFRERNGMYCESPVYMPGACREKIKFGATP